MSRVTHLIVAITIIGTLVCADDGDTSQNRFDIPINFGDFGNSDKDTAGDTGTDDVAVTDHAGDRGQDSGAVDDPGSPEDPGQGGADSGGTDNGTPDTGKDVNYDDPGHDPGPTDNGVTDPGGVKCGSQVCQSGTTCINNNCEPCIFKWACGAQCLVCEAATPNCYEGQCVVCRANSDCANGYWCENNDCIPCANDDPAHCGAQCNECWGAIPVCDGGVCSCNETSCGNLFCIEGSCQACDTAGACGPSCTPCPEALPYCAEGTCVQCRINSECAHGNWCDEGLCKACGNSPDHCGPLCATCGGDEPICDGTSCVCNDASCGIGRRCVDGNCANCSTTEACGPTCETCDSARHYCLSTAVGCVECRDSTDCLTNWTCIDYACSDMCQGIQGCASDNGPNGEECGKAKVIGRTAAMAWFTVNGDTENDGDDDNLPSKSIFAPDNPDCWDAEDDNFYRIYLKGGDKITVVATPLDSYYNLSLKLYRGTSCKNNWENDFITCKYDESDGDPEIFTHTAQTEGWYTMVVDGNSATDDDDNGPYQLNVTLTCGINGCCCN